MANLATHHAIAGRGLAILAVILCLLLPDREIPYGSARLTVLIDQSDGMTDAALDRAIEQVVADIDASNGRLEVGKSAFGIAGSAPTAADALQAALWSLDPGLRNGILIVSDGRWRPEIRTQLEQAARARLPVFWLPAGRIVDTARIIAIETTQRARVGQDVFVHVQAVVPQPGNYAIRLSANDEIVAQKVAVRNEYTKFRLPVVAQRNLLFDAELRDADTGKSLDQLRAGALINVVSAPNILMITHDTSSLGEGLKGGGWPLTQLSPKAFAGLSKQLSDYSALILDDVAATDLPESAWSEIVDAVRNNALGMIVLGGPDSFGLGAYRESILESILPVISEPPEDEQPASVLFLVDISGSMGRQPAGLENLGRARDAVLFSAAALRPNDRVGLIAFDVEAQRLLALASRDDHAAAIRRVWPENASGGTSIIPALDLARSTMMSEESDQKLLLLVTDGMLSADDLGRLESWLLGGDLELVVMNIADEVAGTPLSRSTLGERATMLTIDDVAQLPYLMRDEIESRRPAMITKRTSPIVGSGPSLPNMPLVWPPVDAFLVTRARPEATVMLEAPRGEPLLARWSAGAGRVIALTPGLNQWTTDWLEWDAWPDVAAGLVNHVAVKGSTAAPPDIESVASGRVSIQLDTVQEQAAAISAWLIPDNGPASPVTFLPDAPGRYHAAAEIRSARPYTLVWDDAGPKRHSFVGATGSRPINGGAPAADGYVSAGLLTVWDKNVPKSLAPPTNFRGLLIAVALALFLATIAAERVPRNGFRKR